MDFAGGGGRGGLPTEGALSALQETGPINFGGGGWGGRWQALLRVVFYRTWVCSKGGRAQLSGCRSEFFLKTALLNLGGLPKA